MKKYIIALILLACTFGVSNATNVLVTAKVWTLNSKPVVISVNPASNPRILQKNRSQNYAIYFQDDEKDTVTYTITPDSGFVNVSNGTIRLADYDTSNRAYINFTYFAPNFANANEKIIVTLNDGTNVTVRQLNLYIY